MKLTIIGFWGGYPKVNGASTGYLLEHEGFHLCIDFGSGVLSKLQNFIPPEQIDAVILSHYHSDHIADIGVLQHALLIQRLLGKNDRILPIYGHALNKEQFSQLTYKDITKGFAYDPGSTLSLGPYRIRFMRTNHPVPCFAMRIEAGGKSLVFTGDTSYKEEMAEFSRDCDLLLCECNFYKHQNGANAGHMNSIDAGRLARLASAKNLVLTHLPHYGNIENLHSEAKEEYSGPISLAEYGKEIFL